MKLQSSRRLILKYLILSFFVFSSLQAGACALKNGKVESDDFSGWISFSTTNGTSGGDGLPRLVDFDIRDDGHVSKSMEFKVGQLKYQAAGPSLAGGGLYTNLQLDQGKIMISVDIASSYSSPNDRRNLAGGLFELFVDGEMIATHDFGPIPNNSTLRSTLRGVIQVETGSHELRIRILRPFKSRPHDHAPRQYLDNFRLEYSPT